MWFTQVGCPLYMLQEQFASRVELWRHARPNSSNKVPFAPKHGWMDYFVLGAIKCLSHVYWWVWVRFIKKNDVQINIFAFKHAHLTLLMNFNFNFKNCLPPWHRFFLFGSSCPSLSAFAISKTVIIRNGPFLFVISPGDASCFCWQGLLACIATVYANAHL